MIRRFSAGVRHMLCESLHSEQEEKEVDLLNDIVIINLKNLITNINKALQIKL